jgi:hypothetical protein
LFAFFEITSLNFGGLKTGEFVNVYRIKLKNGILYVIFGPIKVDIFYLEFIQALYTNLYSSIGIGTWHNDRMTHSNKSDLCT